MPKSKPINFGLFRRIPFESTPEFTESRQEQVDHMAFETQSFMRWLGLDLNATGYVFEGDNDTAPMTPPSYGKDGFAMDAITKYKDEHDIECEYHIAIGGGHNSRCGQAISAPSRYGVAYTNMPSYACSVMQTIWHEFIHMRGRQHSGFYKDGEYTYYTDKECLMGSNAMVMPNAGHMCELGLVEYKTISKDEIIRLMPLELNQRDMLPDHYRAVRIGDYVLSIRKGIGIPFPIKRHKSVQIHELNVKIQGTEPKEKNRLKKYTYKHKPELSVGDSYIPVSYTHLTLPTITE